VSAVSASAHGYLLEAGGVGSHMAKDADTERNTNEKAMMDPTANEPGCPSHWRILVKVKCTRIYALAWGSCKHGHGVGP
jgi:hypothetical protein